MLAFPGVVVVWSGNNARLDTHRIPMTPEGLTFGRDDLADATDDRISRQHVRLSFEKGKLLVVDLGSRNGTFVEGEALEGGEGRFEFPAIVRVGRTVLAVVPDIRRYEHVTRRDAQVIGATLERVYAEIDDAAMCEENLVIEAVPSIGAQLAQRYCKAIGGNDLVFEPHVDGPSLDTFLTGTRPRTIVLMLTAAALGMADRATVTTWLETDVRFVIVMWPGTTPLSWMDERSYDRLRSRVIDVSNPRFDEVPTMIEDIVRTASPDARIHSTIVEAMLLLARRYDEAWLLERFREAVNRWARTGAEVLRYDDVADDLDPPRNRHNCLVGMARNRRGQRT